MRGGAIAAGLMLATLALSLGFVPQRRGIAAILLAALMTLPAALAFAPIAPDPAFGGLWVSLVIAALNAYWPRLIARSAVATAALAALAGTTAGLACASDGATSRLPGILAALLVYFPARWSVSRGWPIPPRIVTSWLLAVALLVGAVPYLVVHPGYVADHRE